MSDAAAVVSVLLNVSEDPQSWPEAAENSKKLLQSVSTANFLHGAATLDVPPPFLVQVGLDPQLVATYSTKLVSDSSVARKQYQRVIGEHTRVLTYDMLAECTEGYARVLRLFSNLDVQPPKQIWEACLRLIGEFSLEPFKVLSLWVSVLLSQPEQDLVTPFAEWCRSSSVWHDHPDWIAVFKLVGISSDLCLFLARFVVCGAVQFGRVYALLKPADDFASYEQQWEAAKPQTEVNALTMAMPLVDDDEEEEMAQMDQMDVYLDAAAESQQDPQAEENDDEEDDVEDDEELDYVFKFVGSVFKELSSANPVREDAVKEDVLDAALHAVRSHPLAFGTSEDVAVGLSTFIAAKLAGSGLTNAVSDLIMPHAIMEPAWSALCKQADLTFFRKYMLASIDLHPNNQPFLFALPANERYALYTELHTQLAKQNPIVKTRFQQAEKDTKDVLKRLTKQDASSLIVPQLLDVFSRCPWPSLNVFINQVESYNIGKLVAKASNMQIAPLAMDMLPLVLMQQFTAEGRTTKQQDGIFAQKWFKLLAQFAGDVAVAYSSFDFVSLIKLVLQQFAQRDFSLLVVLEQLLRRLSGIPEQANLSTVQLLALSSAEPVSSLVSATISEQQHPPQKQRLFESLQKNNLTLDVFAALAFAYNCTITASTDGVDAKVVATQLDEITNVMLMYTSLFPEPLSTTLSINAPVTWVHAAQRGTPGNYEFCNLKLFDVAIDQDLYAKFNELCDPKALERAVLSHRLRVKNVLRQVSETVKPGLPDLITRLVLSPSDALFTSRYIQSVMPPILPLLLTRNVVLMLVKTATPLEIESFAVFLTDILTFVYSQQAESPELARDAHSAITAALLEAAHPNAPYTQLTNAFTLLQRCLVVFPLFEDHGNSILNRVRLLAVKTEGDLGTSVKSLSPQLAKRTSLWQSPADLTVAPGFIQQLEQHNDRLVVRLVSGVKQMLNPEPIMEEPKRELKHPRRDQRRLKSRRRRFR